MLNNTSENWVSDISKGVVFAPFVFIRRGDCTVFGIDMLSTTTMVGEFTRTNWARERGSTVSIHCGVICSQFGGKRQAGLHQNKTSRRHQLLAKHWTLGPTFVLSLLTNILTRQFS